MSNEDEVAALVIHKTVPGDSGVYCIDFVVFNVNYFIHPRYKGKKEVKKSPKYEMSYEDEVAALVIHKTEPDDSGVYCINFEVFMSIILYIPGTRERRRLKKALSMR